MVFLPRILQRLVFYLALARLERQIVYTAASDPEFRDEVGMLRPIFFGSSSFQSCGHSLRNSGLAGVIPRDFA